MQRRVAECLKGWTKVYLIVILVLLPIYMKERMVMIGDAKYYFWRNCTVIFLAVMLLGVLLYGMTGGWRRLKACCLRQDISLLDCFVLAYGGTSVVSWIFSVDREIAFRGYADWHMGALTQVLMVASYFVVSRLYNGTEDMWETAGITAALVFLLGFLNRLQIDPLGIYTGMAENDWNRDHLLSTIGNNNWYCGYISVTAGIFVYLFYTRRGAGRVLGGLGVVLTYATLLTQGSESGYVLMAGILGILCYVSLGKWADFLRFLESVVLFPATCVVLQILSKLLPERLVMDDETTEGIWALWSGWIVLLLVLVALYLFLRIRKRDHMEEPIRAAKALRICMVAGVCVALAGLMLWAAQGSNMNWGTGRGALWYLSIHCFLDSGWAQKLIGAGADCFAPLIYDYYIPNELIETVHRWKDIIYANAHCEWLNTLITQGVLGLVAYGGIFVTGIVRGLRRVEQQPILLLGLLMLGGYAANATVSFQQVMATPLLFVLLGMMEAAIRRGVTDEGDVV